MVDKEYNYVDNDFDSYVEKTGATAVYPKDKAIEYLMMGLMSEAGEAAGKYKKAIRDHDGHLDIPSFRAELGDIMWYMARLHAELGLSLYETCEANIMKLHARLENNTIKGDGDDR